MPDEVQSVIAGLQQRLVRALEGFEKLNAHLPDERSSYGPPPGWAQTSSITALVSMLTDKGLITEIEFVIYALREQVTLMEATLSNAAAHLTAETGVIVPLGVAGRPQG